MNFVPNKKNYKKKFKVKLPGRIYKSDSSNFLLTGTLGLKALESGLVNSKQFEAINNSIRKVIKKAGRTLFFSFPQNPKTKKPVGMRMGKGKGAISS